MLMISLLQVPIPTSLALLFPKCNKSFQSRIWGPWATFLAFRLLAPLRAFVCVNPSMWLDLLTRTHMTYAKLARSPCATGSKLSKFDGKVLHDVVGALLPILAMILHTLWINSANICIIPLLLIGLLSSEFYTFSRTQVIMVCLTSKPTCSLMPFVTLIGLAAQIIDTPPQALLCVLVTAWSHGVLRNN
jgi:hypothetical protein